MEPNHIIGCLILLIAGQQLFYSWQIQKLVDKVMSRNYHEYVKATEPKTPRKVPELSELDREDLIALNAVAGLTL